MLPVVGLAAGDAAEVAIELDCKLRTVEVPADLLAALAAQPGAIEAFEALSYSVCGGHARQIESAKAPETRKRRIAAILAKLAGGSIQYAAKCRMCAVAFAVECFCLRQQGTCLISLLR